MVKGPFSRIVPTADGGYRIAVDDEDQGEAPVDGDDDDATAGTADDRIGRRRGRGRR